MEVFSKILQFWAPFLLFLTSAFGTSAAEATNCCCGSVEVLKLPPEIQQLVGLHRHTLETAIRQKQAINDANPAAEANVDAHIDSNSSVGAVGDLNPALFIFSSGSQNFKTG